MPVQGLHYDALDPQPIGILAAADPLLLVLRRTLTACQDGGSRTSGLVNKRRAFVSKLSLSPHIYICIYMYMAFFGGKVKENRGDVAPSCRH